MPRGGYHPHAERWGRKSAWINDSVTKTIRIPGDLADQVLDLAHKLDRGEVIAYDTESIQALRDELSQLGDLLKAVSDERDDLQKLNHTLTAELDAKPPQQLPDLEATRERILAGLKLGKQAPEYKRTKAAIDRFIGELKQQS